jgi:serine/threonine protein kinase
MPDVLKTVGRYEILREVGRGGMAKVYLARQTDLDRFVALKELAAFHASDPSFAQRFLRESRVAGSLSHPNIVTVHDYFQHDGTPYIAMEYVERGSLRGYVAQMSLAQVGGVLEGLLAGLAHAEQHGIVHRDLKPENLMVTSDGRVKIADFGIAKATTRMQTGAFLTATGTTVGTPTYMAPEQAMAQEIGPWTDLYSVGCMAHELFTGKVPFHDTDAPMAILLRHVNEPIPPVKSIDPSIDQGTSDWVERLLVKDPKQRTQSAVDAWDEFEEIVIGILGPRWRREARLLESAAQLDTPKPLTPAPFEGTSTDVPSSDEFESFAWGAGTPYTPPPQPSAPVPPEPVTGPPTPVPGEDTDFVTFSAPAPALPSEAILPSTEPAGEATAEPEAAAAVESTPETVDPAVPESGAFETFGAGQAAEAAPPDAEPAASDGFETFMPEPVVEPEPVAAGDESVVDEPVVAGPGPEPVAAREESVVDAPVAPEPVVAAAGAEVAETVMPESLREPAAEPARQPPPERPRRGLAVAMIAGGAVLAAILGFVIGGSGGGDEQPAAAPPIVKSNTALKLKVPAAWADKTPPQIPGLDLADPKAAGAGNETVTFGTVRKDADNASLLPVGLVQAAGGVPKNRTAVKLGPDKVEAYRYANVTGDGIDHALTLYAVPTAQGVVTIACEPGTDTCDGVANTAQLLGDTFPVGPSADYAKTVSRALNALHKTATSASAQLAKAKTPKAQAAAAGKLQAAYRKAAAALPGNRQLSPADRGVNGRLEAALTSVSKAYGQAVTAASHNNKARYKKAEAALSNAQKQLKAALANLRAAGYET